MSDVSNNLISKLFIDDSSASNYNKLAKGGSPGLVVMGGDSCSKGR